MSEEEVQKMISGMLAGLESEEMQGLSLNELKQAMAHPNAAATIAELMPFEITSVQPGQPAPDFTLPYLPGSLPEGADHDTTMTLSDHFGKRPVALIFGSYT